MMQGFVLAAGFELLLVDDPHVLADAAVLVEDRPFDVAAAADAQRRLAGVHARGGPRRRRSRPP